MKPAASQLDRAPTDSISEDGGFSLVRGGPTFEWLRRARLIDGDLGLVSRRVGFWILLIWAPLAVLSSLEDGFRFQGGRLTFPQDIGFQFRFLVAMPLLIVAEVIVHRDMRPIIDQFRLRGLIPPSQMDRFERAQADAVKLRNSIWLELGLLVVVYAAGAPLAMGRYAQMVDDSWYLEAGGAAGLSAAGLWLVFVSVPLFQFLLLRWYFRLLVWASFLWRVSRIRLDLYATHPDRTGGLGFLGDTLGAFAPIAAAHGILFSGMIASRILYADARLTDFQLEILVAGVLLVLLFAGPLLVFWPQLLQSRRAGLRAYGALGQDYVRAFSAKWLSGAGPRDEPLVGSADIQSLADLGNSFVAAEQMRLAPLHPRGLLLFLAAYIVPILPLVLTMMSPAKLLSTLLGAFL